MKKKRWKSKLKFILEVNTLQSLDYKLDFYTQLDIIIIKIVFYNSKNNNKCPAKTFIEKLELKDRAKILACLKSIEELGFDCPRVQFRQIKGRLWEIKIQTMSGGSRLFYVALKENTLVILHGYKKQSQKAPKKEIEIAEQRMMEVMQDEKNYA